MNYKKHFCKMNMVGFVAGAALLATLTGCVAYVDRPPRGNVYVAPPAVVVEDDYVYYPDYQIYYSSSRRQYFWPEGGAWVARPAPRGVSVDVLFASPSVRMNFHDSPANHHAEIVRQYPGHSSPRGQSEGQKENRNGDQRDDHGR
jgi:hypothetical protein